MITTAKLINIAPPHLVTIFVCVMTASEIYSLSKFPSIQYNIINFLNRTLKAQAARAELNETSFKRKSFCIAKERINKRYPMDWEKIFANPTSNKGLISKIYKELIQLCSKKPNTTMKK